LSLLTKIRKRLLIPGEEITLLGFDFNAQTVRIFEGWMKYSNSLFKNRLKEEGVDGRTAQPFRLMRKLGFDPEWLTLEDIENDGSYLIRVNPKYAPILDTGERPEGLIFLVDFQAATGVSFDTGPQKGNPEHPISEKTIRVLVEGQSPEELERTAETTSKFDPLSLHKEG
jgi:hypothetical protein